MLICLEVVPISTSQEEYKNVGETVGSKSSPGMMNSYKANFQIGSYVKPQFYGQTSTAAAHMPKQSVY